MIDTVQVLPNNKFRPWFPRFSQLPRTEIQYKESGESRDEDLFNQPIFVFIAI